jgi:hypothetical protein
MTSTTRSRRPRTTRSARTTHPPRAASASRAARTAVEDHDFDESLAATVDPTRPVLTDADAHDRVNRLVQTAYVDRWWLLLLDEEGRQLPTLPQIEMPPRFGEAEAEQLAGFLEHLSRQLDASRLVLVWELPRTDPATAATRASTLAAAVARLGLTVPTQVVVRRGGRVEVWRGWAPPHLVGPDRQSVRPARRSAASTALRNSRAIVVGPTPPTRGVIAPATSSHDSSTSGSSFLPS